MGLTPGLMQALMQLPGTKGSIPEARQRAIALADWRGSLRKGILPRTRPGVNWPQEPFRGTFLNALRSLGMPRFTRRHPALLNALLSQMLQMAHVSLPALPCNLQWALMIPLWSKAGL